MTLTRWTSWHLHLTTGATSAIDRILTEVAVPVAEKRPWFFIRYWQGGPHLRLRVADLTPGEATEFTANLKELMLVHAPPHEGEPTIHHDAYTAEAEGHARGETKENRHISDLRPAGVYFAHYEPETERYGGEHVMAASEDLFIRSSALVVELLPSLPSLASRKLAALRLAQSAAQAIGPPKAQAVFYEIGRQSWTAWALSYGYDAQVVDRFAHANSAPSPEIFDPTALLSTWHADVDTLVTRLTDAGVPLPGAVVSSHVHMMHNRFGLTILDELRTYAVLARAFPAPAEAIPDFALPVSA